MHFPSVAWLKSAFRMSEIRIDLNAKLRDVPHKPGVYVMRDRLGHVISTRIVESSGDTAFDAAALDMVKRSDPVPAPPPLKGIPRYYRRFGIPRQFLRDFVRAKGPFDFALIQTSMTYWYPAVAEVMALAVAGGVLLAGFLGGLAGAGDSTVVTARMVR